MSNKLTKTSLLTNTTTTITASQDALSSLPECLLISILTLLPTKTAISTSVLSTRYQHLYTHLSHLSFSSPTLPDGPPENQTLEHLSKFNSFLTSVDHVLHNLTTPILRKFELSLDLPENRDSDRFNSLIASWVRRVCSLHPEDISVILHSLTCLEDHPIKLPSCILQCDTIVSLYLSDGIVCELDDSIVNLPNIKKLRMFLHATHEKLLPVFYKSCPLLVELCLATPDYEIPHVVEISSPNLKSLNVTGHMFSQYNDELVIDAPMLEDLSLICSGPQHRFVRRPGGIMKADFSMWIQYYQKDREVQRQLVEVLRAVSNVRFLGISGYILSHISRFKDGPLPVFRNLSELSVHGFSTSRLHELFLFLKYCPNLEVLVLCVLGNDGRGDEKWERVLKPDCLFTKLRVLDLQNLRRIKLHLGFMEYLLRSGSVLEKLVVSVCSNYAPLNDFEFCQKLFSYPRSSLACEIQYSSHRIIASSKSFKDGILDGPIHYRDVFEKCNCWM